MAAHKDKIAKGAGGLGFGGGSSSSGGSSSDSGYSDNYDPDSDFTGTDQGTGSVMSLAKAASARAMPVMAEAIADQMIGDIEAQRRQAGHSPINTIDTMPPEEFLGRLNGTYNIGASAQEQINDSLNKNIVIPDIRTPDQSRNIQIGDIHLHGVQDVDGLARAINNRLPLRILQDLSRRF